MASKHSPESRRLAEFSPDARGSDTRIGTRRRKRQIAACTIIARNYLSHARILAESFLSHHPGSHFYLLVVDGLPADVEPGDGIITIGLDQLGLANLPELCFKYDVTELSTAVKPSLLLTIIKEYGDANVAYFDPDILISRPLVEIGDRLSRSDIVLIPHLLQPIPLDGRRPSEQDILIAGAYNLGFIAVRSSTETLRFLTWWQERLREHCRKSPPDGLMVDQKWIDLVPSMYSGSTLLRDDTYDVAYWNLNTRALTFEGGGFAVNGRPLSFFHFSGFDPRYPQVLSKHQDRFQVVSDTPLDRLLALYSRLQMSHGFHDSSTWEYGYDRFTSGVRIHSLMRAMYSELPAKDRAAFGNPFDGMDDGSFFAWMTEPRDAALSRFLERLYHLRSDVRVAFPDVLGKDRHRFLAWALNQGTREHGFDPLCVASADTVAAQSAVGRGESEPGPEPGPAPESHATPASSPATLTRPFGVNVVGYLRNESGVGAAARGYVHALRKAGIPVALVDVSVLSPNRSEDDSLDVSHDGTLYGINLVVVNADQHFVVAEHLGEEFFADRYTIGVWQWELPRFPKEWHDRFVGYDELWVGSSFIVNAVAPGAPIPVVRVPPPLTPPTAGSRERGRARLGVQEDEALLAFVFDFHSYFERKNPIAIINAFRTAYAPSDSARLVIKSTNDQSQPDKLESLRAATGDDHRIAIYSGYWAAQEVADLVAACDAYVSMHRSEGIGLTLSHAMSLSKPVIATGWSGNTDFMSVANSLLVRYDLVRLSEDVGPYRAGELWAEPSVEHAAEHMRWVYRNRELAASLGTRASSDISSLFSEETIGALIQERIASIRLRGDRARNRTTNARSIQSAAAGAMGALVQAPTMERLNPTRAGERADADQAAFAAALDDFLQELVSSDEALKKRAAAVAHKLAELTDALNDVRADASAVAGLELAADSAGK